MDPFALDQYLARRQVFTMFKGKFRLYDTMGNLVAYVEQKAFKLKEDITVFAEEEKLNALLRIQARQVIDFSAAYDVTDLRNGETVGTLQRRGLKSMVRDEWVVVRPTGETLGKIQEDSALLAFLRRFLTNLIPQSYHLEVHGQPAGVFKQHFNPFIYKLDVDLRNDPGRQLDRRLALAAVVLLMAIEGRQD